MGCGVQLRGYGFTMQETGELFGGTDESGQLHALEAREEALTGEIERLLRVRKSLRTQVARIRQAECLLDACTLEEKPAMYFLGTLRGDSVAEITAYLRAGIDGFFTDDPAVGRAAVQAWRK